MSPADLRVPLSALPGLPCRGLLVYGSEADYPHIAHTDQHLDDSGRWTVRIENRPMAPLGDWSVDLSDAATRDRVARWLAGRVGLEVGCTAPRWFWHVAMRCWVIGHGTMTGCRAFSWDGRVTEYEVPSLADLDPDDDTLLPDGSRLVDAVALARVAVHVGGS